MYADKVKELKEEIKEELRSKYRNKFRVIVESGNEGRIHIITYNGAKEEIIEVLEEKFKDKIEIKQTKKTNYWNCETEHIYIKAIFEKTGIDLEIEQLELKLKELKEQRRKQQEKKIKEEKIEKLKRQLKELE